MQDLDSRAQHLRWEHEALLQTHMDEREAYLAAEGLTVRSPTPEQETSAVCSDVPDVGRLQDQTCFESVSGYGCAFFRSTATSTLTGILVAV